MSAPGPVDPNFVIRVASEGYNCDVRVTENGLYQWKKRDDPAAEWSTPVPVRALLSTIPPTEKDIALKELCQYILKMQKESISSLIQSGSPYRKVPDNIIAAAKVFGVDWVNPEDNYSPPTPSPSIRPPLDLGCLGTGPVLYPPGDNRKREEFSAEEIYDMLRAAGSQEDPGTSAQNDRKSHP